MATPNSFSPCPFCGGSEADCCERMERSFNAHPFDEVFSDLFAPVDEAAEPITSTEAFMLEFEEELSK